ncbi:MAG: FKBP-type peptidyl-prolyl cis-trans isomerase [Actinomycetota bacterium]
MTESKQARARQARQQQRLAEQYADRAEQRRRRRRILAIVGTAVTVVVIVVTIVVFATSGSDAERSSAADAGTPDRVDCVGLKDPLPAGAPKVTVPSGPAPLRLVSEDLVVGTGPVASDNPGEIEVKYLGVACRSGKIFDSSWQRQATLKADIANLIPGWQQGIPGMREGGRRLLRIPPDLAYGQSGGPGIPPNEPLIFVIDLVKA